MESLYTSSTSKELFQPIKRAYLLFSHDEEQADEAIQELRGVAVDEEFADFDLEVMDADSAGADRILAAVSIAPFASPVRLVIVRRAELYRKREFASEAEKIGAGISGVGASSSLVLRAVVHGEESGRSKTVLHPKLDSAVRQSGAIIRFGSLGAEQVSDWVAAE